MSWFSRTAGRLKDDRARPDFVPILGVLFCLLLPLLPATAVIPGPLRGQGSPARLIAFTMVCAVIWHFARHRRRGPLHSPNPGIILLLLFLGLQLLTFFLGAYSVGVEDVEANKTRTAIATIAYAFVAIYVASTAKFARQQRWLIGSLVVSLTWAMAVGILQNSVNVDLRDFFVPPGFPNSVPPTDIVARGSSVRAVGTSLHAIEFVILAAAVIPLALHLARFAGTSRRRKWAAFATAIGCIALPLAVSRTGVLALIAAVVIYSLGQSLRFLTNLAAVGIAGLIAYTVLYPGPLSSLTLSLLGMSGDASISTRTDDYEQVAKMFTENPWFGIGLGGNPSPIYPILDNQWLQASVQGGLVGVLALGLLVFTGFYGTARAVKHSENRRSRDQAYALGATFAAIAISTMTSDLFTFQQATGVMFIVFGLLWSDETVLPVAVKRDTSTDVTTKRKSVD